MSSTATKEQIKSRHGQNQGVRILPHLIQGAEAHGDRRRRQKPRAAERTRIPSSGAGRGGYYSDFEPFTLVSLELQPKRTVVDVSGVQIGGAELVVMAGPCSSNRANN